MELESINKKVETIESEVNSLKSMIIKVIHEKKLNHIVHIGGALKGLTVGEDDLKEAKKSLFKAVA